jgi:hypothetical protein
MRRPHRDGPCHGLCLAQGTVQGGDAVSDNIDIPEQLRDQREARPLGNLLWAKPKANVDAGVRA